MDLTEVLARFWGIVLVTAGSGLLINKKLLPEILRDKEQKEFMLLTGFIALLIGAIHVASYNYFELSIRGLITLFGWAALIKGAVRLAVPEFSKNMVGKVGTEKYLYYPLLVLLLGIGLYFLYFGFL